MTSFNIDQTPTHDGMPLRQLLNGSDRVQEPGKHNGLERNILPTVPANTNRILKQLPVTLLKKLQPQTRKITFTGGEYICRPDEEIDWIYFPETIALSELQILEDGRTIEVSLTGREGAVGLPALYWRGRSVNWVQVCTPGSAIKIKRDVLRNESRGVDWVNGLFHRSINSYIAQISQKVACNAHHTVEERFSTWLLMLQDRCSVHRLKLTQEHVARVLGVYRPSVTCIAQEMRQRGLIDYVRGNIVILDRLGLIERSCACYPDASSMDLGQAPELGVRWA